MRRDLNTKLQVASVNRVGEREADEDVIPFWNVNVPPASHTKHCPDFLEYALSNKKDRKILSTPDDLHQQQTWQDVQQLVRNNRLDLFARLPSDLRTYREYCHKLTLSYGTIIEFVMQERLHWSDMQPSGAPFSNPDDFKILCNDWPYGLDPRVVHLVVWTKFDLPADPESPFGDMTPETRAMIDKYVNETFVSACGSDNVLWFKNWRSLKSIDAVEHFHVMLFDPPPAFVDNMTNGDIPLAQKIRMADKS